MRDVQSGRMCVLVAMLAVVLGPMSPCTVQGADEGLTSSLAVGLTLTDGNSDTLLTTASLNSRYSRGADIWAFALEGAYGETDAEASDGTRETETTTQNAKAGVNYKRKFGASFAYGDGKISHDDISEVEYRTVVGAGGGVFLVDGARTRLSVEGGAGYLWEDVDEVRDDYPALRLAERLDVKLSDTARFWQSADYVPEAEDLENYLATAEVGVEAAMNAHMNLRVVIQDKYDSLPGAGLEKNDVSLISGLTWTL